MVGDINDRRKQLLQQRMREQNLAAPEQPTAPTRRPGERSALSAAQRRLWFVQTLDPADAALNVCVAYRLDGALDSERLRAACADVVARHEILRTTYHVDEAGEPYQVSQQTAELYWHEHDLSELVEPARGRRIEVLAKREFARPYDLSSELPLRVNLIRTGPAEHVLVLVVHHIGWDDDSWPVFFAEINAAYRGTDLPELAAQYVDVDRATSRGTDAADLDYWRSALTPPPERLELPSRAGAGPRSNNADRCARPLSPELLDRVTAFGREHGTTAFTVLLAAFEAALYRYTAATDFLVSVPVTNRTERRAEPLIGYFGNTVLVRATPERGSTFATLVDSTKHASAGAFAHQGVGIDDVIRVVSPDRTAGRDGMAQLVQLSFGMRGAANGFDFPDVVATELAIGSSVAQEELGLMVVLDGADARVEATYLVDELDGQMVEQFLDHYVQLLVSVLGEPDRPIRDIDMLGGDRAGVLDISHGALVAEEPATVVAMMEHRVAATPENVAVCSDGVELTFGQLNARANRLAHWLIARNIGAEDIVALKLATSVEFIVGTLAVLKAGAAYLPIDPAYPAERIDFLDADAKPKLTLDGDAFAAAETDAKSSSETNPADADRVAALYPSNTAYVIYTSGSTGRPKGVPVPHNAIAEHLSGFVAEWDITADDRVLQSTSVSFDASLLDIYVTLVAGARVVVPKPNAYRDIPYVAELVTRHGVSVLHMVPSMLATFLLLPEVSAWRTLRHVPVGGEALAGEVADRVGTVFDAELRNHYGPTEAVVSSTHMSVEGPQGTGIVPIGIPNRNVYLYVLDDALHVVPNSVVGEIYLGGNQLARGYLDRPGLTAERFVADPFLPGGRLYRTGDLARRNSAGAIEFVGRADEQVKVRGHRIELGEVESVISDSRAVAHAVVVVTEHESLGQVLVAYVVPAVGVDLDVDEVRARVAATLPAYMVPAAFTIIDEIPLTAHGKLDKRALPAADLASTNTYREPSTATEHRIAALYGRLFERDRIGADDSFFELGGHSLLAARLVSMIRAEFGVEIDIRVPFDTPTVAGLASHLVAQFRNEFGIDIDELAEFDEPSADTQTPARPPLVRAPRGDVVPLSYSQRMYWLQRRLEGAIDGENVAYPIRFDGPLDTDALHAALDDVAARHESLRTTFPEHDGTPHQLVHPATSVPLEVVDLRGEDDADAAIDRELAADSAYVFDLQAEPSLRLRLLEVDESTRVLSILMHHIIADHRSCQIFVDDLTRAYRARLRGVAPDWADLDIAFTDFSRWQHEVFDRAPGHGEISPYGQSLLDYWLETLDGLPDEISVAHDRPRPTVLGRNGISTTQVISADIWQAAKARAEQAGATDFMLCQAMSATTLHLLGGGDDLAIGAAVANRLDETTNDIIGLFANMVVLRNDLSGDPTPRGVLRRVRDAALNAITRQGVPFDRLVETINPPRRLSRNPLFQVVMHFRDRMRPTDLTEDGATIVTSVARHYEVSFMDFHFDYTAEINGELTTRVVVNSDIYEPATGAVFVGVLARVIEAFAHQPDSAVSELDVLPSDWDATRSVVRASAAPASQQQVVDSAGAAPATDTERTLAGILEELLEITDIGREDGFFALGGDSIIAIQLATRAGEAGLPLAPQMVFEYFTIAELAAAVDETLANPPADDSSSEPEREDRRLEPMAASGLDDETLRALQNSWSMQR